MNALEVIESLENTLNLIETEVLATPTSERRNLLKDSCIHLIAAITLIEALERS
jgi:hypothetical protein